jgi:ParE toxin of type II toxin-antitoxin system, parDE
MAAITDRERRIREGDYRAVYTIDDTKVLVEVTRIRHRSEVYERRGETGQAPSLHGFFCFSDLRYA